ARPARGGIASSSAITFPRYRCEARGCPRRSLRAVRRLAFDVADVDWKGIVAELLPDRLDLSDVIPVVVRQAADRRALRLAAPLSVQIGRASCRDRVWVWGDEAEW